MAGNADKPGSPGRNTGHGHVWPRPDGVKARCGGPPICRKCTAEHVERFNLNGAEDDTEPTIGGDTLY